MTVDELLGMITPRVWVTPALSTLIVIGFAVELWLGVSFDKPTGSQLLAAGGQFGPSFAEGAWWRALSSMFLHAGPLHLAFNLWAFWSAGKLTERVFGNVAFLVLYVLSGIGGSLTSLVWSPLSVSVGASGAIFGVYGALLAFVLLHRGVLPPAYLAHQRNSIVGFIGYNVVFGLSQKNTDMAAHAGGFVIGALAGAMLGRDLLAPAAGRLRRALGAAGVAALLLFSAFVVQRRLQHVPEIKAGRDADAALAHLKAKEFPQAIARYTDALAFERRHASLFNRGLAYLGAQDLKSARKDIHDADLMESTAQSKSLLCELGTNLERTPEALAETEAYCTAALAKEADPHAKATLYSLRAYVRALESRGDDSLADADAALALDEHATRARVRRTAVLLEKRRLDEAEAECARLVAEADAEVFTFWLCSRVAHGRNDGAQERARLDRCLAFEPDDRDSHLARAWLNSQENRLPESLADYDKAIAIDPANPFAWNNRAWVKVELGDFAGARADADRAVAADPNDASYLGTRCFALVGLGELAAARADCARSIELRQTSKIDSGMLAFIDKRYADARRDWQKASDEDPAAARELRPWLARIPAR